MSKIYLKTSLIVTGEDKEKYEYTLEGIKTDNKIKFFEDKTSVVLIIFDNALTLLRKTDRYILEMKFGRDEYASYNVKGIGSLNLEFTTKELKISDQQIKIVYDMNDREYSYTINIEVKNE